MRSLRKIWHATALAALVSTPAFAVEQPPAAIDLDAAFGGSAPPLEALDIEAMQNTRGRFPMLAIPLAIAGVDIGLTALFWGVYVPNYGQGGYCGTCPTIFHLP